MRAKVVRTAAGWEPAFDWGEGFAVEPGFAQPTRHKAEMALRRDLAETARIEAAERAYASAYAHACGYHD